MMWKVKCKIQIVTGHFCISQPNEGNSSRHIFSFQLLLFNYILLDNSHSKACFFVLCLGKVVSSKARQDPIRMHEMQMVSLYTWSKMTTSNIDI